MSKVKKVTSCVPTAKPSLDTLHQGIPPTSKIRHLKAKNLTTELATVTDQGSIGMEYICQF